MIGKPQKLKMERLYIEYASKMKYAAMVILKDEELAEDAVHNSFLKLPKNIHKLNENDKAKTGAYLIMAARNAARTIYKKRYGHGVEDDIDEKIQLAASLDIENIAITNETRRKVADILKNMNTIYSDVFILYYVYEHTVREIASMTNSTEDAVRKRIQRARERIKSEMEA